MTPEQQARDMMERAGWDGAQSCTAGDVAELASLIAGHDWLLSVMRDIAQISHSGGLANLTSDQALIEIRRRTLLHWDGSGSVEKQTARVRAALGAADRDGAAQP